jgi:hypothetical protein
MNDSFKKGFAVALGVMIAIVLVSYLFKIL